LPVLNISKRGLAKGCHGQMVSDDRFGDPRTGRGLALGIELGMCA